MKVLVVYIWLIVNFLSSFQAIVTGSALTACFYSNWAISRPGIGRYSLDDIPDELCSHILYGFIGFSDKSPFKITEIKPSNDHDPNGLRRFSELRSRLPRSKLLVSIGGWGLDSSKLSKMVSTKSNREQFVESVVSLLTRFNLDGLNFLWFWPGHASRGGVPEDKANFALLLKELGDAFEADGRGKELTVSAPIEEFRLTEGYAVADVCRYVDYVYLTAYDLRGSWNNFADVHSPTNNRSFETDNFKNFNVMDGVALWIRKGCPAGKIVLGIATLGRTYTLQDPHNNGLGAPVKGGGELGEFTQSDGYVSYYEICKRIKEGWTIRRDTVGQVPYISRNNQWIGYDDVESLKAKVDIIKKQGLAGAMIYALDMDDFGGICGPRYPLTQFVSSEMKKLPAATHYEITFGIDRESY